MAARETRQWQAPPVLLGALAISLLLNIAALASSGSGLGYAHLSTPPVLAHAALKPAAPCPLTACSCPQCDACPSPSPVTPCLISPPTPSPSSKVLPWRALRFPPSIHVDAADYIATFQEDALIRPHERSPFRTSFVAGPGPL